MDISKKIREAYINYVLEHERVPKSIYKLANSIKIKEEEFYEHYNSIDAVENDIWRGLFTDTVERIQSEDVYTSYSVREKMLAFYYTWIEELKSKRSYILFKLDSHKIKLPLPKYIKAFKSDFKEFINELILEARESQEIVERPYIIDTYPQIFWSQALLVLRFWLKDTSKGFENTDAYIEKAVNFAFDAMGKTALDSAFDFAKFAFQNR